MIFWSSLRASGPRHLRRAGGVAVAVAVGLALTAGCLKRPVVEQDPKTTNVFVDQIRQTAIDKIDLLFVIDNSISMADKQAILARAVPALVRRLVTPDCVTTDAAGDVMGRWAQPGNATADNPCPAGGEIPEGAGIEFDPVDDIHIGVVTSSLGGHGGEICTPTSPSGMFNASMNDRSWLLPSVREGLNSFQNMGFLAWDPGNKYGGESNREQLTAEFTNHVTEAGEIGCGYEATLEAWYRFLIDPSPPMDMVNDGTFAYPATDPNTGAILIDNTVLQQREAFLRPDSLVAIIMLTDENDCSVVDGGIGWLTAHATSNPGFTMPAATQACSENPNSRCCRNCALNESAPPDGCAALGSDPGCTAGRPAGSDSLNLRCFNQKERFGFDLLYPIERYVAALRDPQIVDTRNCANNQCAMVPNPLFAVRGAPNPRDPSLVFLAGIVGVPWQDIATEPSLSGAGLEYLTAAEMNAVTPNRWSVILGNPDADNPKAAEARPLDPLMVESSDPRVGTHPITGEPTGDQMSNNPAANSINGHEYINTDSNDLQYACIFPLEDARDCTEGSGNAACDCTQADLEKNRPLCNPPGGGAAGETQYFAKAYPGTRLLHTLRDFGDNSIVASICPKNAQGDNTSDPNYGYNPAVAAIIDRLKEVLGGRCLPRQLVVEDDGSVPCAVVEATLNPTASGCDSGRGRGPVDPKVVPAVHKQLEATGSCGGATGTACNEYFMCEILQLTGDAQQACLNQVDYPQGLVPGYCYIDEDQMIGNAALLQGCPATERRKLQFVGDDTPTAGSITFIACVGAAFTDDTGNPTMP